MLILVFIFGLVGRTGANLMDGFVVETDRSDDSEVDADRSNCSSSSASEEDDEVLDKSEVDEQVVEEMLSWFSLRSPSPDDSESLDNSDSLCGW
jgi:hypothetical protein